MGGHWVEYYIIQKLPERQVDVNKYLKGVYRVKPPNYSNSLTRKNHDIVIFLFHHLSFKRVKK